MAKKKKKKAAKKKNVSSTKKKKSTTKKKSTAKVNNSSKNNVKKVSSSTSKNTNEKKDSVKKSVAIDKNVKDNKNIKSTISKKAKLNKSILVISFVLLILGVLALILFNHNINNRVSNDGFLKINFDEYLDLYEKEGLEFVYLYNSSCINCDSYEEKLIKLEKEFEIKIKKFDYSKLNSSDISILKSSNSFLEDGIPVPMLISIKNGNEISGISGIKEYSALKNFAILSKSENGINNFSKIDVDEYLSILNSKDKSFVYICDSSDACNNFSKVLETVSTDRKIKVKYLNTENIVSSSDWDKLEESNKIFKKMWFMPVIMVVKDNKVIDYKMETMSEKDLNKFFKKNGM